MKKFYLLLVSSFIYFNVISSVTSNFTFTQVCKGDITNLESTSTGDGIINYWAWDLNNDGVFDDATGSLVTKTFLTSGAFNVGLKVANNLGDTSQVYKVIWIYNKPVANFTLEGLCFGSNTIFENTSTIVNDIITKSNWSFGDGFNSSELINTAHHFNNYGVYNVKLLVETSQGCLDSIIKTITINSLPNVAINYTPDTVVYRDNIIELSVDPSFVDIEWSTGDTTVTTQILNQNGKVSVSAHDVNGCNNISQIELVFLETGKLNARDIITPNSDGKNDFWEIEYLRAYSPCKVIIYNKLGVIVYEDSDYQNDWYGTYDGKKLPKGTYYYMIEAFDKKYSGAINIIY